MTGNVLDASCSRDGYGDIMRLIKDNYRRTSLRELVTMVHEHYNKYVKPWVDHGEWTKRSIAEHIVWHSQDDDVQINEGINSLVAQIESIRNVCWYTDDENGKQMPDHRNIKLLHDLVKTTAALVESRKKKK